MASRTPARTCRSALTLVLLCAATLLVDLAAPTSARAATRPPLGTAFDYAVLAGASVTNTGATVITGDLGVSPNSSVTGYPPGVVIRGTIHANDASATQAHADLAVAYSSAAGEPVDATLDQDLGGRTLTPGAYDSSVDSFTLSTTLTLDGQGDPDAVFLFKTVSSLTTAAGSSMSLINGAQACNVFWQIGSSATIGSTSQMAGDVLANTSITAQTGSTIDGRVLAVNGTVTTDSSTVTRSFCARELSVDAPVSAGLGAGSPGGAVSGQLGPVTVTDSGLNTDTAWTASVTSSSFVTAPPAHTVTSANVNYWSGPATSETGDGTFTSGQPTASDAKTISVPATTAFTQSNGDGATSVTWNPTIVIGIPVDAVAGEYTGTVTFSVA